MCLLFFLLVFEAEKQVLLCGAAGAGAGRLPGLGFRFPVKWWDSPPPLGDLEPANQMHPVKARGRAEKPAGA